MGLLGIFRREKRVHADPELGEMAFRSRSSFWEGLTAFPDGREPVGVAIPGDESAPSPEARAVYDELRHRYMTLRDEIAGALYELYEDYSDDATEGDYEDGLPRLSAPGEIWGTTNLDDVTIWNAGPDSIEIELTYTFDWHQEHTFGVRLENWKVMGVSIDG